MPRLVLVCSPLHLAVCTVVRARPALPRSERFGSCTADRAAALAVAGVVAAFLAHERATALTGTAQLMVPLAPHLVPSSNAYRLAYVLVVLRVCWWWGIEQ